METQTKYQMESAEQEWPEEPTWLANMGEKAGLAHVYEHFHGFPSHMPHRQHRKTSVNACTTAGGTASAGFQVAKEEEERIEREKARIQKQDGLLLLLERDAYRILYT